MAERICSIPGCPEPPPYVRGWCSPHYQRYKRYGDPLGGGPRRIKVPGFKRCIGCQQLLPVAEFYKVSRSRNKYQSRCKSCDRVRNRERYRRTFNGKPMAPAWTPEYRRAYSRDYRRAARRRDPERFRREARERYAADPERVRAYARQWSRANWERERERHYAWRRANPQAWAEVHRRWRVGKRTRTVGRITLELLAAKWAYWGDRCWICGGPPQAGDHVKPIARGGLHCLANLRPICRSCNSIKSDRWPFPTGRRLWRTSA